MPELAEARVAEMPKQPTDRPKPAVQIEAEAGETVTVTYAGVDYRFPAALDDADGDVIDAVDDQKISHALRGLMPGGEWERFKATSPKIRDYAGLFDTYAKAIGLETTGN